MLRTVSMMQPYLFPYLGYFQLIATSDVFVLGDDLQYVRGSWINRNRVLANGLPKLVTFALRKGHQTDRIDQRWLCDDFDRQARDLLIMLERSYAKAPHRDEALALVARILQTPERNLALFAEHSIRSLCAHLGIDTPIHRTSALGLEPNLEMQERVIQIVEKMHGELYINPIGGMELYCPAAFRERGLQLRFLQMNEFSYRQFKMPFVPALSIIDVLMFNSREEVRDMLDRFSLLKGKEPQRTAEPA